MKPIETIMFFPNGNTSVCDFDGEQIPLYQESWIRLFVLFLIEKGVADDELREIRIFMPNGRLASWDPEQMNWRIG